MALKFAFSETKALQALAFIACECPGLTPLYVSKILFFAEKWHLNKYGRPVIADTYIAMARGPVPSTIKNFIDQKWNWVDEPDEFEALVRLDHTYKTPRLFPGETAPNRKLLSLSDVECLTAAVEFCREKTAEELSELTHREKAWLLADTDRPMDYEHFVDDDNPNRDLVLQQARENAVYGVL